MNDGIISPNNAKIMQNQFVVRHCNLVCNKIRWLYQMRSLIDSINSYQRNWNYEVNHINIWSILHNFNLKELAFEAEKNFPDPYLWLNRGENMGHDLRLYDYTLNSQKMKISNRNHKKYRSLINNSISI